MIKRNGKEAKKVTVEIEALNGDCMIQALLGLVSHMYTFKETSEEDGMILDLQDTNWRVKTDIPDWEWDRK